MNSNSIRWPLLILASVFAVPLTWFGLMAAAFSEAGWQNPIAVTLFWLLPSLSLPVLATYGLWKRVPPATMWGFAFCQWIVISWLNWDSYLQGRSTTSNPLLILLSGGVAFPVWCWIAIAAVCQLENHFRRKLGTLTRP
ncbi:hypothetical protein [Tunturiibacter psychrotolerans]|jgi:hypothetical protein|uniref:hypothetical protein n=1 Tax=Tunturiibacter psychrotolerans TaxID=3069686 RepID=UPI003D1A1D22